MNLRLNSFTVFSILIISAESCQRSFWCYSFSLSTKGFSAGSFADITLFFVIKKF